MYDAGRGAGPLAVVPTGAGIAVLPNTGDNRLLAVAAIVSIVIGSAILLTTLARFVAKHAYKA